MSRSRVLKAKNNRLCRALAVLPCRGRRNRAGLDRHKTGVAENQSCDRELAALVDQSAPSTLKRSQHFKQEEGERLLTQPSAQPIFKIPIILLAIGDLVILVLRLWPWQNVMSLPGNGTAGLDPAIALAAYVGLGFWIGTASNDSSRKSLLSSALLGIVAGLLLVAQVVLATRQAVADTTAGPDRLQIGLVVCAALAVGIAGLRSARAGHPVGFSAVCAIWASMVACLLAVSTVLGEMYVSAGPGEASDPWKDYQGLAIGTPAMQALVHWLQMISGFLLIGPIVGCTTGAIFASFGKPKKA